MSQDKYSAPHRLTRRQFLAATSSASALALAACASNDSADKAETPEASTVDRGEFAALELSSTRWNYDADTDCYWQVGLSYCLDPVSDTYQRLAIYVPGAYFKASRKGNSYVCTVRSGVKVGNYTVDDAPFLMPINAPSFSAQEAATAFPGSDIQEYLDAGIIYVYAGFRGRSSGYDSDTDTYFDGGAPWGVADLKAAVRYLRYNASVLPGNTSRIFVFGHGAGGTLASLMGSTGDAPEYSDYLSELGAATHDAEGVNLSDKVYGAACWCPLPLDHANAAYEWMMGQYANNDSRAEGTFGAALSDGLAASYGDYLNALKLADDSGNLVLDETSAGICVAGSYYDHVLSQVEQAFDAFVAGASFPVTIQPTSQRSGGFPGGQDAEAAEDQAFSGAAGGSGGQNIAGATYDSLEAYLAALNSDYQWITYDNSSEATNMAGLGALATHVRPAARDVCAYDSLKKDQAANQLFGVQDSETLHFDQGTLDLLAANTDAYSVLDGYDDTYSSSWTEDLDVEDTLGHDVRYRVDMCSPLHYLSGANGGFGEAGVAEYWRIRSGVMQSQTTLTGELGLAAALRAYDGVADVDCQLVWDAGFAPAERSGSATENLLAWVAECCSKED